MKSKRVWTQYNIYGTGRGSTSTGEECLLASAYSEGVANIIAQALLKYYDRVRVVLEAASITLGGGL